MPTDTLTLLCLDCAGTHLETPLGVLQPIPGRCQECGRCTLVVGVEDEWRESA